MTIAGAIKAIFSGQRRAHRQSKTGKNFGIVYGLTLGVAVLAFGVGAFPVLVEIGRLPSLVRVRGAFQPSARIVLDRSGRILDGDLPEGDARVRLNWISLRQVSPHFIRALLEGEDRRFFYHPGVDPAALWRPSRTLTLQVARELEWLSGGAAAGTSLVFKALAL
ncbi:MAG: hypothetical protein HC902_11130, partial [Calothrix sp. SM1_5_4]|nr:hypothetical protein [Calothrix sp. SM1_5_4]